MHDPARWYGLVADGILVVHTGFVLFVVLGFTLILAGLLAGWSWVRNRAFRIAHLCAVGFVVVQAWLGRLCPLTIWESALRRRAGEAGYESSFVGHWLGRLIYYDAQPWVFTLIYTAFGGLVVAVWLLERRRRGRSGD